MNTYFGLILSNYRFVVEVWYFRPVLTKGEVRRTLQVSRRCHNAPHIHRRETEVLRRMFFSGWITGTNISFTSGVGMTRCIPDVKNPRTLRIQGRQEGLQKLRSRFVTGFFMPFLSIFHTGIEEPAVLLVGASSSSILSSLSSIAATSALCSLGRTPRDEQSTL